MIFNKRHLRRVLSSSIDYYQRTRTHLSPRIAPTHARLCHAESERSSPYRKSAACIIATNVSPPDSHHFLFTILRGRRYASFKVSRSGVFDLDNGAEHLSFRSLPDSLLRANFISKSPSCSNWGSDGIFGRERAAGPLQWQCIEPGMPVRNAFVESFKSKLGDKCLNQRA